MKDDMKNEPSEEEIDAQQLRSESEMEDKIRLENLGYASWNEYDEAYINGENDGLG
jgi:hypothetical protein|tara:strand:- start:744 stop:911 length:168 start_codon:yes stop_codon:yes gene_type:complete